MKLLSRGNGEKLFVMLVVIHQRFTTIFTTFDGRDLPHFASFCRVGMSIMGFYE